MSFKSRQPARSSPKNAVLKNSVPKASASAPSVMEIPSIEDIVAVSSLEESVPQTVVTLESPVLNQSTDLEQSPELVVEVPDENGEVNDETPVVLEQQVVEDTIELPQITAPLVSSGVKPLIGGSTSVKGPALSVAKPVRLVNQVTPSAPKASPKTPPKASHETNLISLSPASPVVNPPMSTTTTTTVSNKGPFKAPAKPVGQPLGKAPAKAPAQPLGNPLGKAPAKAPAKLPATPTFKITPRDPKDVMSAAPKASPKASSPVSNLGGVQRQVVHGTTRTRIALGGGKAKTTKVSQTTVVDVVQLVLEEWQQPWAQRAIEILTRANGIIDTSDPGAGKTILAIFLALHYNLSLFVICPPGACEQVWRTHCAKYGAKLEFVTSYNSICSSHNRQPKGGYLVREDYTDDKGKAKVRFFPTQKYFDVLARGALVVCDEFSKLKNEDTAASKACTSLLELVVSTETPSRYAFLSATPFTSPKSAVTFLRMMGYIKQKELYLINEGSLDFYGVQDLLDECNFIDEEITTNIVNAFSPSGSDTKNEVDQLCSDLFINVIAKAVCGNMVRPIPEGIVCDMRNGFFDISEEYQEPLYQAIVDLSQAIKGSKGAALFNLMKSEKAVTWEHYKCFDMARVAKEKLESIPGSKGIICVNHPDNVDQMFGLLLKYKPVIIKGGVTSAKRDAAINSFTNDPACRVFIITTALAMSMSLHDTKGDAQRFQLISPCWDDGVREQASGRATRMGVMSDVHIYNFFTSGFGELELEILDRVVAARAPMIKGALKLEGSKEIRGHRDYEAYYESDPQEGGVGEIGEVAE